MNNEQIKEEIKDLSYGIQFHRGQGDFHHGVADKRAASVQRLEAQLAEAEKPKLRHGDYGYDKGGSPRMELVVGRNSKRQSSCPAGPDYVCTLDDEPDARHIETKLGNIFDDLDALSEPLKEFKVMDEQNERTVQFVGSPGNLYIELTATDGERVRNINIPSSKAVLNLRRLLHTAEQEQNAKP